METLVVALTVGFVIMTMLTSYRRPQPIIIEVQPPQRRSVGCLPIVFSLVFAVLLLSILS